MQPQNRRKVCILFGMRNQSKKIAVVTMGVKLGDETRGYTRFRYLSELLVREGFEVDLITSTFQHWDKAPRDCSRECYKETPYKIVFIEEPGYTRNLDLTRIRSHAKAAQSLRAHFEQHGEEYALIYAEIPPNDVARVCAEYADKADIPFVADINDLWPEAMRMVVNIPIISDVAFYPFSRDAKRVYTLLSGAVGTSDEYAERPAKDREKPYPRATVYVGNDLAEFDAGAKAHLNEIKKPKDEIWVTYAGTLGASYDITTLIEAAALLAQREDAVQNVRVKILGDGPDREVLEALSAKHSAPVDFLGYQDYAHMAAYLVASDITINSLVASAVQSIVTKIGDYLASAHPMINTGSSHEFKNKVSEDGFGVNVEAENPEVLADAIEKLAANASHRKIMGAKGRAVAENEFDRPISYHRIVDLIRKLI